MEGFRNLNYTYENGLWVLRLNTTELLEVSKALFRRYKHWVTSREKYQRKIGVTDSGKHGDILIDFPPKSPSQGEIELNIIPS
jgi:hypothetical protein